MPKFAANLSMLFTELPFLDRFAAAARAGFEAVEFLFPYEYAAGEIKQRLQENQLQLVLFNTPPVALLISLGLASWTLGIRRGMNLKKLGEVTGSAIPSSADVILVAGAGGAFGGVLVASGIGNALAEALETIHLPLMPAAFLLSLVLRASQGSATVAILTTSGLLSQAVVGLEPLQLVLVTLATCFGSLGLSHVNDAGFWVVTRYLGLSVPDGLKTWTVLTTIMGVTGFLITWLLWFVL